LSNRAAFFLIAITFIAFISLGSPDGLLDIANPHVRETFDIGKDIFGLIFVTGLVGYFLSSFFAGQLVAWMGIGLLLSVSCAATAGALIGYALSPAWGWFVVMGLLGGAGAGAIDTGLNTYVATHYGPRLMFWLHASFGLGVTGGTALMSLVINAGRPWRMGYALVGALQLALAMVFFVTRARFDSPHADSSRPGHKEAGAPLGATLRVPMVWIGIALFFLYAGAEVVAGRWASSLFIEGRGISTETAGMWVSLYGGMFTAGRVLAGFVDRWMTPLTFIRLSMAGSVIAALLLAWNPVEWSGGVALGLMGLMFAPIFPILVSVTPERLGNAHTANAIGFQIGAASIGAALLPGLTGVLAQSFSITVQPFVLLAATLAVLILHEFGVRGLQAAQAQIVHPPIPDAEAARLTGDR